MSGSTTRREFLKAGAAAAASCTLGGIAPGAEPAARPARKQIWANLLHLSYNMWCDWGCPHPEGSYINRTPDLRFDEKLWNDLLPRMSEAGMNMVVIDLGDGVKYGSHPEIAVNGAWSTQKLRAELRKIRDLGLEPIPKLNFSTCHDSWMNGYDRQVSTDVYYKFCAELIAEVIDLFDKPRLFHLGMDEETAEHQKNFQFVVVRQHDLWWHDFLFLVEQVEKGGSRPWIWADFVWVHPEAFWKRMPKNVLQSNWYYAKKFERSVTAVDAYHTLDAHGYEQVPTGSNYSNPENFELTVKYCRKHVAPERLLGFIQTPWRPTLEECRQRHVEAIEQVRRAISAFNA